MSVFDELYQKYQQEKEYAKKIATKLEKIKKVVNEQAEDEGLWFEAQYASEAYLQQQLRWLHATIEDSGNR